MTRTPALDQYLESTALAGGDNFFASTDAALDALEGRRVGVLEFYVASAAEYLVFDAAHDQVRLFLVPWLEASGIDVKDPLPHSITAYPKATCERTELISHLWDLRREFARAAIESDPRLAAHEPLRLWSLIDSGSSRVSLCSPINVNGPGVEQSS